MSSTFDEDAADLAASFSGRGIATVISLDCCFCTQPMRLFCSGVKEAGDGSRAVAYWGVCNTCGASVRMDAAGERIAEHDTAHY